MTNRNRTDEPEAVRRQRLNMIQALVGLAAIGAGCLLMLGWGAALVMVGLALFCTSIWGMR